jgi:hypothetical protein
MTDTSTIKAVIEAIAGVIIAIISAYNAIKTAQLKNHINSRMDELLKLTQDAAHAKGIIEGKETEKSDHAKLVAGIVESKDKT